MWGMIPEKRLMCHIEDLFVYQSLPFEPTHTRCRDGLEMLHAVIEFIAVNIECNVCLDSIQSAVCVLLRCFAAHPT